MYYVYALNVKKSTFKWGKRSAEFWPNQINAGSKPATETTFPCQMPGTNVTRIVD